MPGTLLGHVGRATVSRKAAVTFSPGACGLAGETGASYVSTLPIMEQALSKYLLIGEQRRTQTCEEGREHRAVRTRFTMSLTREHEVLPGANGVHMLSISN